MSEKERYQLRKAAGMHWLLDMEQEGREGKKAVALNECGAYIWEQYKEKHSVEEIAQMLHNAYGVAEEDAKADVAAFFEDLKVQGICLEI